MVYFVNVLQNKAFKFKIAKFLLQILYLYNKL